METLNKFKNADFLGITENGNYSYAIPLENGGFSIEIFDTKQHEGQLSKEVKHYIDMYLRIKPKDYIG